MQVNGVCTDLMLIRNVNYLFDNKVVIYGTGKSGKALYEVLIQIGVCVCCFCETIPKKKELNGLEIISQEELANLLQREEVLILVGSVYFNEIYDDLLSKGLIGKGVVSRFAVNYAICLNRNNQRIPKEFRTKYNKMFKVWKRIQLNYVEELKLCNAFEILSFELMYPTIFVFQPGKVGSMSIHSTIKNYGFNTYHCHMLNERNMVCDAEYQELLHMLKQQKVKIITGVREPIARAFSAFVHCLEQYQGWLVKDELSSDLCESYVKYLRNYVCHDNVYSGEAPKFNGNEYCTLGNLMGNEFAWFDKEIKGIWDIDIFAYNFDREAGYSIIRENNIEIFIYKLEKLNDLESQLGEFTGISGFKLDRDNIGEEKVTRNLARQLKKETKIPKECLDYYYINNEKFSHFYTEEETEKFRKKWSD